MIQVIVSLTKIMEESIRLDKAERTLPQKYRQSRHSYTLRKMKKKRKLAYYFYLKSKIIAVIYTKCYNKNDTSLPKYLIPKNRPEKSGQEYELRLKYARQRLQQEADLIHVRRNGYEKKFNNIDKEFNNLIKTIYAKDPLKAQSLKDPWKIERRNEEIKLQEMWQHKEVIIRSNLRTFKISDNHFEPGKAEREKRKRTTIKPPKSTYYCNEKHAFDSQYIQILQEVRKYEHEYMTEHETKVNAMENGEQFDNSTSEEIGVQLEKLQNALKGVQGQVESVSNSTPNGGLHRNKVK